METLRLKKPRLAHVSRGLWQSQEFIQFHYHSEGRHTIRGPGVLGPSWAGRGVHFPPVLPSLARGLGMGSLPPSYPCPHAPILAQAHLLGEELEESGAVSTVLLGGAHHTDRGDDQLRAGIRRAVHRHGQTWSHRHVHALRGTRKFRLKFVQAELL